MAKRIVHRISEELDEALRRLSEQRKDENVSKTLEAILRMGLSRVAATSKYAAKQLKRSKKAKPNAKAASPEETRTVNSEKTARPPANHALL